MSKCITGGAPSDALKHIPEEDWVLFWQSREEPTSQQSTLLTLTQKVNIVDQAWG